MKRGMQAFCTQPLDVLEVAVSSAQAAGCSRQLAPTTTAVPGPFPAQTAAPRRVPPWGGSWAAAGYNVSSCKAFIKSHLLATGIICNTVPATKCPS